MLEVVQKSWEKKYLMTLKNAHKHHVEGATMKSYVLIFCKRKNWKSAIIPETNEYQCLHKNLQDF